MKLIGDVGGTNVRFALVDNQGKTHDLMTFRRADFEDVTEAIVKYFSFVGKKPLSALIAVNTTVINGEPIKNRNYWGYSDEKLLKKTGLKEISFINDGVAHAMAVLGIEDNEKEELIGGVSKEKGTILVLGIGTEIGTSVGIWNECLGRYVFEPSESGQQFVSPMTGEQRRVINKMLKRDAYVRWNHIASGTGIAKIYNTMHDDAKKAAEIMGLCHSGDRKAAKTFDLFCQFLGMFVQNMAYTVLPAGGIYLTGGILSRMENLQALKKSQFLDYCQLGVGQVSGLRGIPIYVCNISDSALRGLAQGV